MAVRGNSVLKTLVRPDLVEIDPASLEVEQPFSTLFPVSPAVRDAIVRSLRDGGYHASKPIEVWRERGIVVDGHTRRQAAIEAGLKVWACYLDFADEDAAFEYAVANQRNRRNLTDADVVRLVQAVDRRKTAGRPPRESASSEANNGGKSAEGTARLIGTSRQKAEKARTVLDHAEPAPRPTAVPGGPRPGPRRRAGRTSRTSRHPEFL